MHNPAKISRYIPFKAQQIINHEQQYVTVSSNRYIHNPLSPVRKQLKLWLMIVPMTTAVVAVMK